MTRRIAITGGMGAGKSLLAHWLRQAGHAVVDADALGREALEQEGGLRQELLEAYGPELLGEDGRVDRRGLARLVFASRHELAAFNARVFPYLQARLAARLDEACQALSTHPELAVFLDAALVFEWGVAEAFDEVWLVRAPDDLRLRRAARRLGLSEEEARQRMLLQLPQDSKAKQAQVVLDNDGEEAQLFGCMLQLLNERGLALPPASR